MRRAMLLAAACLTAASFAIPAAGQDVTRSLIAEVIAGARTDAERATKLLAAAKLVTDEPDVMAALLSEAVDYGIKAARSPAAGQAALEAVKLLDQAAPDKKDLWRARRLALYRAVFRSSFGAAKTKAAGRLLEALLDLAEWQERAHKWSDAKASYQEAYPVASALRSPMLELVTARRARATHYEKAARQVEAEKKKLATAGDDPAPRQKALELLMAELDDPDEAQKLLTDEVAESWRTFVPLAAKDPNALTEGPAGELARWLSHFLAPKASRYSKMRIMLAARQCAEQAVALHTAKDAEFVTRKSDLQKIEKRLDALAGTEAAAARTRYADILKLLNPYLLRGTGWVLNRGVLTFDPTSSDRRQLRLPAKITGDFQLTLRFAVAHPAAPTKDNRGRARKPTPRGLNLAFPVAGGMLGLSLTAEKVETRGTLREVAAGAATGLFSATVGTAAALTPGRIYQLDVIVFVRSGFAIVKVDLDRKPLVRWQGKTSRCSLPEYWRGSASAGSPALGGWKGPTTFASVKLRSLGGRMKLWRPEPKPRER